MISVPATSLRTASIAPDDLRSSTRLFLPTLSWPKAVEQLFRSGGRLRMVSPSTCSILMTSALMSASILAQCGPAIVVEKSRTRRPSKHFVTCPSWSGASVIPAFLPRQALGFGRRATLDGAAIPGKLCVPLRQLNLPPPSRTNWCRATGIILALHKRSNLRAFLEGLVRHHGDGRLRPRRRTRRRFRGAAPRTAAPERCQDPAAGLSRRCRTIHADRNRGGMRGFSRNACLLARAGIDQGRPACLRPVVPTT